MRSGLPRRVECSGYRAVEVMRWESAIEAMRTIEPHAPTRLDDARRMGPTGPRGVYLAGAEALPLTSEQSASNPTGSNRDHRLIEEGTETLLMLKYARSTTTRGGQ